MGAADNLAALDDQGGTRVMAVFLVYVAAIFGLFAVLAAVEEWLTGREQS